MSDGGAAQALGPFVEPDASGSVANKLEVVNEAALDEQELGWEFVFELLQDVMKMKDDIVTGLNTHMKSEDHTEFHKTAHSLKGAALNLRLPALVEVTRQAEWVGKELLKHDKSSAEYAKLRARQPKLIEDLHVEYSRLEQYMPIAEQKAAEAKANGDDATGDFGDDEA